VNLIYIAAIFFHLYVKINLNELGRKKKNCRSVSILRNTCGSSVFT